MSDFSTLNAAVAALVTQVENTVGTEASAVAFIQGLGAEIQKAVDAALLADANADDASIQAANTAIAEVVARAAASAGALAAAIPANPSEPSARRR